MKLLAVVTTPYIYYMHSIPLYLYHPIVPKGVWHNHWDWHHNHGKYYYRAGKQLVSLITRDHTRPIMGFLLIDYNVFKNYPEPVVIPQKFLIYPIEPNYHRPVI